jgi:uncharacterized membrane protein
MSRYELYLFIHIAAAVVWVGGGLMTFILGARASRAGDEMKMKGLVDDMAVLSKKFFVPSSLIVVIAGVLMIVDGPWSFDQLWIVLGLVGYAATFATGLAVFEPTTRRISAAVERDGGFSAAAVAETRRLLILGRLDVLVLFLVIADMTFKPTGDDVGLLVAMAVILVAGIGYIASRLKALDAAPGEPVSARA